LFQLRAVHLPLRFRTQTPYRLFPSSVLCPAYLLGPADQFSAGLLRRLDCQRDFGHLPLISSVYFSVQICPNHQCLTFLAVPTKSSAW
jgi:hypothetical protein